MAKEEMTGDPLEDEFVVQLIDSVEQNSCVYNRFDPLHKIAEVKHEVWKIISSDIGFDGHPVELERKWRHLRDKYVRLRKQEKLNGPIRSNSRWYKFFKRMSFLDPHVEHRNRKRKEDRLAAEQQAEESDSSIKQEVDLSPNEALQQLYTQLINNKAEEEKSDSTPSPSEPAMTPGRKKKKEASEENEPESEVSLFVRSIAKTLESMDPKTFSAARLEISKVLHNCQYGTS